MIDNKYWELISKYTDLLNRANNLNELDMVLIALISTASVLDDADAVLVLRETQRACQLEKGHFSEIMNDRINLRLSGMVNEEDKKIKEASELCRCGEPGEYDHSCPYDEEINNNYDSLCNCCNRCYNNCLMDI